MTIPDVPAVIGPGAAIGRRKATDRKLPPIMDKTALLGTWKLKSYLVTSTTGERVTPPYGESPTGFLSYSADGRMQVMGVAKNRKIPGSANPPDKERLALYDTMFAYAGTFRVEGDKIIHHIDISWNEAWTGTDQIRVVELSGNTLTLTTRILDPVGGVESHYAVTWEKVTGSR